MNYANHHGYSDINPYEIIKRVSDKTLDIRAMSAERDPEFVPEFVSGGFFGTVVNQSDQRWIITSDPAGRTVRIRLRSDGDWYEANGRRYVLADKPHKFYDYNF